MNMYRRFRIWIVALLALCAIGLVVVGQLTGHAGSPVQSTPERGVHSGKQTIAQQVDAVVAAFKIPRSALRFVPARQGSAAPPAVRLLVAPEFSSVEFNCALGGALADLGAVVVGTEHLREKNVSLMIMKDGAAVMQVILDMRKSSQQSRKGSSH